MKKIGNNITAAEVKELDRQGLINRSLTRAPLKDTVTVPDGGYTIVRFHANNPGKISRHAYYQKIKQQDINVCREIIRLRNLKLKKLSHT